MPKRVIDFDAMWGSDKLAACAGWAQAEYAWLYGLADASGCFELTNLRVIWGRVAAVRHDLPLERLELVFKEFHAKGLLFIWEENGKRYGHWSGSDVPGRLPPPSWRMRLERLAPPVPKQQFAEYMAQFARGRAASPGGAFLQGPPSGAITPSRKPGVEELKAGRRGGVEDLNAGLEEPPAQDLDLNWDQKEKGIREGGVQDTNGRAVRGVSSASQSKTLTHYSNSENLKAKATAPSAQSRPAMEDRFVGRPSEQAAGRIAASGYESKWKDRARSRELAAQIELNVGRGPSDEVCGPIRIKSEALARIRAREAAARAQGRDP